MKTSPSDPLVKHISVTYFALRMMMALIAICFPLVLWFWSSWKFQTLEPGPSISGYYHEPVRDVFVGSLCAIGVCLIVYRGFTTAENLLLNIAGICIVGVALVPTACSQAPHTALGAKDASVLTTERDALSTHQKSPAPPQSPPSRRFSPHGLLAALFFITLAIVAWTQACRSLHLIENPAHEARYRELYKTTALSMLILPAGTWVLVQSLGMDWWIFAFEAVGVWVFAAYWLIKTHEFRGTEGQAEAALLRAANSKKGPGV